MSFRQSFAFLFLSALVLGIFVPAPAIAQVAYPTLPVCDPNYYKTLREKGWMEAMREVQVNNTVITKPASVLALSCFDQHMQQVSAGGNIFTDTGNNPSNVADAINITIGGSFNSFIGTNFKEPPIGSGVTFSSGNSYGNCDHLTKMWESIKCAVVDNSGAGTGFLMSSVDQYRTNADGGTDVRGSTGTPSCAGTVPKDRYTQGMKSSSDLGDTANVRGDANYFSTARPNFCAYDPKTGSALGNGDICPLGGAGKKCSDMNAIPTGVAVAYPGGTDPTKDVFGEAQGTLYWTYRCLNPGCYVDVKGNAGALKVPAGVGAPPAIKCQEKPYS